MKRFLVAASLTAAFSAPAIAQEVRFQGTFFVTSANATCGNDDPVAAVGDNYVFAYRLDETGESFALFDTRKAFQVGPSGSNRFDGSGNYDGAKIKSDGRAGELSGKYSGFKITPGTPNEAAKQILVVGTLTNFDRRGCTVKFTASAARRPD